MNSKYLKLNLFTNMKGGSGQDQRHLQIGDKVKITGPSAGAGTDASEDDIGKSGKILERLLHGRDFSYIVNLDNDNPGSGTQFPLTSLEQDPGQSDTHQNSTLQRLYFGERPSTWEVEAEVEAAEEEAGAEEEEDELDMWEKWEQEANIDRDREFYYFRKKIKILDSERILEYKIRISPYMPYGSSLLYPNYKFFYKFNKINLTYHLVILDPENKPVADLSSLQIYAQGTATLPPSSLPPMGQLDPPIPPDAVLPNTECWQIISPYNSGHFSQASDLVPKINPEMVYLKACFGLDGRVYFIDEEVNHDNFYGQVYNYTKNNTNGIQTCNKTDYQRCKNLNITYLGGTV